jgi:hypothetical protein
MPHTTALDDACTPARASDFVRLLNALIALAPVVTLYIAAPATAAPIYTSKGKDGTITYSSKAPQKGGGEPHELPEIMKGKFASPAPVGVAEGCNSRGGVHCELGADRDGSVICKDGFRDAPDLFRFVCPHPKLEVLSVQQENDAPTALLVIKNTREVSALAPSVRLRSKTSAPIPLSGPQTLEGGALGVYELVVPKGVLPGGSKKVLKNHLWITCGNCG